MTIAEDELNLFISNQEREKNKLNSMEAQLEQINEKVESRESELKQLDSDVPAEEKELSVSENDLKAVQVHCCRNGEEIVALTAPAVMKVTCPCLCGRFCPSKVGVLICCIL